MIPYRIHRAAEAEFWEAIDFYECKVSGLGFDFIVEFENAVGVIRQDPERWRVRSNGARRYNLDRFPYYIAYLDLPDHVWIVAVAHGSQRPGYWRDRLRIQD